MSTPYSFCLPSSCLSLSFLSFCFLLFLPLSRMPQHCSILDLSYRWMADDSSRTGLVCHDHLYRLPPGASGAMSLGGDGCDVCCRARSRRRWTPS